MVIALGGAVFDVPAPRHRLDVALGPVLVHPLGKAPHPLRDMLELDLGAVANLLADPLLELRAERHIIQKDPRVPKVIVELLLHTPYAADRAVDLRVPSQHHQHGGRAGGVVQDGVLAAGVERRVEWPGRTRDLILPYVDNAFQ